MKVNILILFLFVFVTKIFAQKEKKYIIDIYNVSEKGTLYTYGFGKTLKSINVRKVKKDYSSVENLLTMQISSDSVSFSDKLYKNKKSRERQEILDNTVKMPRDSVYFLLESKLEVKIKGSTFCIVKGKFKSKGTSLQPTCLSFEKVEGNWYFANNGKELTPYYSLFFTMSVNTITEMLVYKYSNNKYLNDIIMQCLENGIVNLDTFFKVLNPKLDMREPEIKEFMEPSLIKK